MHRYSSRPSTPACDSTEGLTLNLGTLWEDNTYITRTCYYYQTSHSQVRKYLVYINFHVNKETGKAYIYSNILKLRFASKDAHL